MGRCGGRSASHRGQRLAMDSPEPKPVEHTVTIEYKGDFNMRGFLRMLYYIGGIGASRSVTVDYEDDPFKSTWDGDGADKILSAEIDGVDILNDGAQDFGIGELSSTDMEKFRRASPSKQNELIRLLEQIKRTSDPNKKSELQSRLRVLESSM